MKALGRSPAVLVLVLLVACGIDPAEQAPDSKRVASKREAVVSGRVTFDDPEIFAFMGPGWLCSSTLIGRRTLLTAGHCVTGEPGGRVISPVGTAATNVVDSDRARARDFVAVVGVRRHPRYGVLPTGAPENDLALLQLEREPPVPPKPWNREPLTDAMVLTQLRVVGYGDTAANFGAGLKRTGLSVLKAVRPLLIAYGPVGETRGGTCQGDSGGPALRRFADGAERVIGVTSYGQAGCVGTSDDPRVDVYESFIQAGLDKFEGGACVEDGRCRPGCTPVDPDCACVADGQCNVSCTSLALDPDCASSCGLDGVCSTLVAACTVADPDCWPVGSNCGYEAHCASRLCITSGQHAQPYCSQACASAADCALEMDCVSSQCQYRLKPTAAEGEPCVPGATFCDGASMFCAGWDGHPETRCRQGCYEDADCTGGTCRSSPQAPGVCVPNVLLERTGTEVFPTTGCTSAPGALAGLLGLALFRLRRRRPASEAKGSLRSGSEGAFERANQLRRGRS